MIGGVLAYPWLLGATIAGTLTTTLAHRRVWRWPPDRVWCTIVGFVTLAGAASGLALSQAASKPDAKSSVARCDQQAGVQPATSRRFVGVGDEGQITGGNIVTGGTTSTRDSFGDPVRAALGDDITVMITVANPGPSFLADVRARVTLGSVPGDFVRLVASLSSINADPKETTDTLVINVAEGRQVCARYVPGSTTMLDYRGREERGLPDGITQGGIGLGEVQVPIEAIKYVKFRVQLDPRK